MVRTKLPLSAICVLALWIHFFWSLVPSWRFGVYYEYGFLVPALAIAFAWRRADLITNTSATPWLPPKSVDCLMVLGAVMGLSLLIPLRIVQTGDPGWRPPIVLHGFAVVVATHLIVARFHGWKLSGYFFPVTVFAWSAVPYFGRLESELVRALTGWVLGFTREIFLLNGYPVEQVGEKLRLGSQLVEVTDGCSGIRSIQSLIMAALFFGELLWLRWFSRITVLAIAVLVALFCNTGRAWFLAYTQFSKGLNAVHAVHDLAGHIAFIAAALLLLVTACAFRPEKHRRQVVRIPGKAISPGSSDTK